MKHARAITVVNPIEAQGADIAKILGIVSSVITGIAGILTKVKV